MTSVSEVLILVSNLYYIRWTWLCCIYVNHTPFSLMDHALIMPPKVFARAILPPSSSEHVATLIVVISLVITPLHACRQWVNYRHRISFELHVRRVLCTRDRRCTCTFLSISLNILSKIAYFFFSLRSYKYSVYIYITVDVASWKTINIVYEEKYYTSRIRDLATSRSINLRRHTGSIFLLFPLPISHTSLCIDPIQIMSHRETINYTSVTDKI